MEKRSHNTKIIQNTVDNNKSIKRTFKNISFEQNQIISLKDKEGNILHDRHKMSNRIKEFYEDLYDAKITNKAEENYKNQNEIPDIILKEIEMALKSMPNNKTPGADQITTDMIKNGGTTVLKIIQKLFNRCLKEKKIPQYWNNSNSILIHRKGDCTDLKTYRPISLLSHLYKLFAKILFNRLKNKLEKTEYREQAGSKKGFSTIDRIHTLNQILEKTKEFNLPLCVHIHR